MVVRSTQIELWPSDPRVVFGDFEFLRQNLSIPRVHQYRLLDLGDFWTDISVGISNDIVDISAKL